jgi:putative flavoprotein involved in K+ transport
LSYGKGLAPRTVFAKSARRQRVANLSRKLKQGSVLSVDNVETLIIGGGQAGLSMSAQLSKRGLPHLIVERHRIAERWRSERWDGLRANGPAWHDRLALMPIPGVDPDGFATPAQMVEYFVAFAERVAAPIRCGVEVNALHNSAERGFRAQTPNGEIHATNVVVATGPFQRAAIPPIVPSDVGVMQIHSSAYRNPAQLPEGAVLVVGAGSSGTQIADELSRAGRQVFLSVGRHERPPRRYRGPDYCWWLGVLGKWDATVRDRAKEHVTIAVTGAYGGYTIDFRRLAARGVTLVGRADAFEAGAIHFLPDLASSLAEGDDSYLSVLDEADAYVRREGLDLPEEPAARQIEPDPACVKNPILRLELREAGISAIVWATGYALDLGWLKCGVLNERGVPIHQRGITGVPGLYLLGLSWLSRRASSFIFGVERDAAYLADRIAASHEQVAGG